MSTDIKRPQEETREKKYTVGTFLLQYLCLALPLFLIEALAWALLKPVEAWGLLFGAVWALMLTGLYLSLPRLAGRILYGIAYFAMLAWTVSQSGYYQVFGKLMWLSSISFAGEGATFLGDVISKFPLLLWVGGGILLALGVVLLIKFPRLPKGFTFRIPCLSIAAMSIAALFLLPELVFLRDKDVWGTRSEYAQSSSYRARYETMYDARSVFDICGVFQMTFRDVWMHEVYPMTPAYRIEVREQTETINSYFANRPERSENEMTGVFQGKNVILVLMESMDDWMITPEDTPTLYKMMEEGINFTNFYTPGYGTARTFNSEFCMNTGGFLPTTGTLVFDYVTNDFNQSFANQMNDAGYTSEMFHYNDPSFYSRGVFEPALGYNKYNCYADYETDKDALYGDCLLFDIPELSDIFFREGQTFNTVITRSAHLSYVYNEVLSHYALKQYPEYRGKYGSQEEDCARVKARLVDDMFTRMVEELEARGQLENTVIIGLTDHYTYGYKNMEELYAHSGVDAELLLEKVPCFVWSPNGPDVEVDKTLNTSDFLPTMLNLLGIDSPYNYLGQDAFDDNYVGYAIFPDGSWATQGVVCKLENGNPVILQDSGAIPLTEQFYHEMNLLVNEYIGVSNLLLTSNYYQDIQ